MRPLKHFGILGLAAIISVVGLLALAGPPAPTYALPTRETPTPTPPPDDRDGGPPVGAYIELQATGARPDAWTVVQWQDSDESWHDVEGWQGMLEKNGGRRWWVAARDFGSGPFRWVITQGSGGSVLGVSQHFSLPSNANQVVTVAVSPGTP